MTVSPGKDSEADLQWKACRNRLFRSAKGVAIESSGSCDMLWSSDSWEVLWKFCALFRLRITQDCILMLRDLGTFLHRPLYQNKIFYDCVSIKTNIIRAGFTMEHCYSLLYFFFLLILKQITMETFSYWFTIWHQKRRARREQRKRQSFYVGVNNKQENLHRRLVLGS